MGTFGHLLFCLFGLLSLSFYLISRLFGGQTPTMQCQRKCRKLVSQLTEARCCSRKIRDSPRCVHQPFSTLQYLVLQSKSEQAWAFDQNRTDRFGSSVLGEVRFLKNKNCSVLFRTRNQGTSVSFPFGSVPVITDGTELPRCINTHSIANFDNISPYLKENNVQWAECTTNYKEFKEK